MRSFVGLWLCVGVACAGVDPGTDTDTPADTGLETDTDTVDTPDTDPPGPSFPEDVLIAGGGQVVDPEFLASERRVVWQAPDTQKIWVADVDPATGLWVPADGKGRRLGTAVPMPGTQTAPATYNGPEWGNDGAAVFFTAADADGSNQVAMFPRGGTEVQLLTGGDLIHRSGAIPQFHPAGDRAAVLYFIGPLADLNLAWRWTDDTEDHPFAGTASADPTPRWLPREDAILSLSPVEPGTNQVTRYDLASGEVTQLTNDAGLKSDPFVTQDPAGGRVMTVYVSDAIPEGSSFDRLVPSRIRVYRETTDGWTAEADFGIEDTLGGGPFAIISLEPFVVGDQVWLSFIGVPGAQPKTPSYVYVAKADGTQLRRVTDGAMERNDPEVLVIEDRAFLYYTESRAAGLSRVHLVRDFLP